MLERFSTLPGWLLVTLVAGSILAESGVLLGVVLPGTTAVIAMGVVAGLGLVAPPVAYLAAALAATAGVSLGWRSGRRAGPGLRSSPLGRRVGEARWAAAERVLGRHGASAVVVAQFVVVARTLVPRLVGMSAVPYRRFARASIPAALTWAVSLTALGHLAGASYAVVSAALGRATVSVAILAVIVLALAWLGRMLATHPHWITAPPVRSSASWFRWVRRGVEGRAASVAGGRSGQAVAALVWAGAAVLVGVLTTLVVLLAVNRAGLRVVDDPVHAWLAKHTSEPVTSASLATVSVLRTPFVVVLVTGVAVLVLVRLRDRLDAGARLRIVITAVGLVALALATRGVVDAIVARRDDGDPPTHFLFVTQVAVVPCALVLAAVLLSPWLSWRLRVTVWTLAVVVVVLLVGARLLSGFSTVSEVVIALGVGTAWSVLLASAVRAPAPVVPDGSRAAPNAA